MSAIEFDHSFYTGIEAVDDQHRTLIDIYNELDAAYRAGKANRQMGETLARLFQYTRIHFRTEEGIMERYGYEGLAAHRHEHAQLVERLRKFIVKFKKNEERISREMVDFVGNWVTHHIQESDMAFAAPVAEAMANEREREPVA